MPRPLVLLTRPAAQSERFAEALRARIGGAADIVVAPVMKIVFRPAPPVPERATLVFTSENGVAAMPDDALAGRALWAVGPRTAAALRARGVRCRDGGGDAVALAQALVAARPAGPVLHLAGVHTAGDVAGTLRRAGIPAERHTVYDQVAEPLSAAGQAALAGIAPVILPLFSPRSARLLRSEVARARAPLAAVAISDAVAATWNGTAPCTVAEAKTAVAMADAVCAVLAADVSSDAAGLLGMTQGDKLAKAVTAAPQGLAGTRGNDTVARRKTGRSNGSRNTTPGPAAGDDTAAPVEDAVIIEETDGDGASAAEAQPDAETPPPDAPDAPPVTQADAEGGMPTPDPDPAPQVEDDTPVSQADAVPDPADREAGEKVSADPSDPAAAAADEPVTPSQLAKMRAEEDRSPPDISGSPIAPTPPPAASEPAPRGPGFVPLLLGGVLAGGIGFAAAYYLGMDEPGEDPNAATIAALDARVSEQAAQLEALGVDDGSGARIDTAEGGIAELQQTTETLRSELAQLAEALAGLQPTEAGVSQDTLDQLTTAAEAGIADLADTVAELSRAVDDLSGRVDGATADLAALSQRVDGAGGPTAEDIAALDERMAGLNAQLDERVAALNAELDERMAALDAALDEQGAAIVDAQAAAESETRRISTLSALSQIAAALENGAPFQDAVGAYESASGESLPPALTDAAPEGVATLRDLQASFPDAARDALDASIRATTGGGAMDRLGAFIRSQTRARSLGEREGDDADAVLSRAEARLREGDVAAALTQLDALPEQGQAAMSGWIDRARIRVAAIDALADVSAQTNTN
ncbi:hypothetical protein DXV76_14410 [Rhodobacteraceae bacterium CCMM004]|nr:hypothetical protein DXV76_14410 [Rhodobacteraceae bacterium CCMM004]